MGVREGRADRISKEEKNERKLEELDELKGRGTLLGAAADEDSLFFLDGQPAQSS